MITCQGDVLVYWLMNVSFQLATINTCLMYWTSAVIRDFPKSFHFAENKRFQEVCTRGIMNCVNLRACTWTRDGSLTTDILCALQACPDLQELEINGHHEGHYEPALLANFRQLRRISLIMPSGPVIDTLPCWTANCASTLRHLSLICKVFIAFMQQRCAYVLMKREAELVACDRCPFGRSCPSSNTSRASLHRGLSESYTSRCLGCNDRESFWSHRPGNWSSVSRICKWSCLSIWV